MKTALILQLIDLALGLVERGLEVSNVASKMIDEGGGELTPAQRLEQSERLRVARNRIDQARDRIILGAIDAGAP